MKKPLLFCTTLLLSACATDQVLVSAPSTEVKVLVTVPCVDAKDIPVIPKTAMPAGGDVGQDAAGAAADVLTLDALARRQNAILKACATAVPQPPKEKHP